jgi:hypothetical protein
MSGSPTDTIRAGICSWAVRAALTLALAVFAHTAHSQGVSVTAEQVETSIDRAARYLIQQQKADGSWPEKPLYGGGLSPLCTLALLHAGYEPESEPVRKALEHLRKLEPSATYARSLQTMAFCRADAQRDMPLIARNVAWLEAHQVVDGESMGMWAIPVPATPDHTDNSMTHMAMLALYDAEQAGATINPRTWQRGLEFWQRAQNGDGSWGWGPGFPGSGSMTCAGVASLMIAEPHFSSGDATIENGSLLCCAPPAPGERHVERGMNWLARNFSVNRNPGSDFWHSYYLFALERVGRLRAERLIGQHDWYREAAETLIAMQLPTGAWPSDMDEEHLADPLVATSFSLLFMSKARRPLVVGELVHEPTGDGGRHRAALGHLMKHVEKIWRRELAHQRINVAGATVEDLLATPVLYLNGKEAPQFTAGEKRKLRMYVDRGGTLFADQSCGGGSFDEGWRALLAELFPEPESRLHLLGPNHPVWRVEEPVAPNRPFELWGVEASCRTAVFYCPQDLSCRWEVARLGGSDAVLPEAVAAQVKATLDLGANVLSYATNREVKYKDPRVPETSPANAGVKQRGVISVANVLHDGGCTSAPGSLWTLLRLADDKLGMPVDPAPHEVRLSDEEVFRYNLLVIHGRTAFEWTPAERENLRRYVERGGGVLADAVCSSKDFTASLRRELQATFEGRLLEPIPADSPLFSSERGGVDLRRVMRRPPMIEGPGGAPAPGALIEGPPVLESLSFGQGEIIFSPYDLSCALESRDPVECGGYTRSDAARIAVNVLIHLLQ